MNLRLPSIVAPARKAQIRSERSWAETWAVFLALTNEELPGCAAAPAAWFYERQTSSRIHRVSTANGLEPELAAPFAGE
jgi:hypothetical protein